MTLSARQWRDLFNLIFLAGSVLRPTSSSFLQKQANSPRAPGHSAERIVGGKASSVEQVAPVSRYGNSRLASRQTGTSRICPRILWQPKTLTAPRAKRLRRTPRGSTAPTGCADPRTGPRGLPGAAWRSSLPSRKPGLEASGGVAGPRPGSPAEISSPSLSGSEGFAAPEEGEGGPRGSGGGTLCQEGAPGEDDAAVASTTTQQGHRVVPEDAATSGDEEDGPSRKPPGVPGDALEPERPASGSEGELDCILPAPGGSEDAKGAAGTGENEPSAFPDGEEDAESECPICTEVYDGDVHRPSRLNCGHELCARCLGAVLEASGAAEIGRARCPLCRQKTPVVEWEIRKLQEEMLLLEAPQESAAGRAEYEPLPERRPGAWGRLEHRFQVRFRASRPEHGALPCLRYPLGMVQGLERLERRSRWLYRLVLLVLLAAETLSLLVFFLPLLVVFLLFAILER
ncbi:ring finger protein-like [Zootoca vivipara]|uniref:ring finger protein-like n=1 Tax=Zootoca vivipara TaxID=8524 RepID=UPI00293C10E2|nr:ring finger protein-like [Zootoca vivipara]